MNRGVAGLLPFLIALAVLAAIGLVTANALRTAGAWESGGTSRGMAPDPYARLDGLLARAGADSVTLSTMRDPFGYGGALATAKVSRPVVRKPTAPPPLPMPILTAIVSDANPAAVIQYEDRSYTVKPGDLFAEFRVISVTSDAVVLERGGERLTLARPRKGE